MPNEDPKPIDEAALDDPAMVGLAVAILDGAPVDWRALESGVRAGDEAMLRQLRVLAGVGALHRSLPSAQSVAAAAPGEPPPGDGLGHWGPLTLLERIGEGAFGEVFRAWDGELHREVALKLLYAERAAASPLTEGRLLARVRHPNVVTVYGGASHDGRTGLWMEFVRGRTLAARLREDGPLPGADVVRIGVSVCEALSAVHAAGLLHRDVKAQNVMVEDDGRVVLMDFGAGRDQFARAADMAGTPLYLAPEVFAGGSPSVQSDIYSVGILLFHMLTGSYPVVADTAADLAAAHEAGTRRSLASLRPDVSAPLTAIVDRAIAPSPVARFETADAMAAELRDALGIHVTTRRRRYGLAVVGIALMATLGSLLATWHRPAKGPVAFQARDWVLVTTFDNRTGDPQFNGTLEHALSYELSNSTYVNVVPRERVDDALRLMARPPTTVVDATDGPEVALRDGGIRLVLDGMIERVGAGYAMTVRIVEPHSATTIASDREEAPTAAAVPAAVRRLSNRIRMSLGEAPVTVTQDSQRLEQVTTPSLRALSVYSEALRAFNLNRFTEAEALFKAALAEDPGFASAEIWLAWTQDNLGRPPAVYLAVARKAVDAVDSTTERERYWVLGSYYRFTNQNDLAVGQFEALARRYPDDSWGLLNLLQLYGLAGHLESAADLMVRMADARPNDFAASVRAAQAVLHSRGLGAARPLVSRAMRLLPAASDIPDGGLGPAKSWMLMFPAHDLWIQGRAREASAVLDAVSTRPELSAEGDWALVILGKLRLALGQVRLAESVYSRIRDPDLLAMDLSEVALARGDRQAAIARLSSYHGTDFFPVSLLVRAGDPGAAERRLRQLPSPDPIHFRWATEEIDEARGNTRQITTALKTGVPWTKVMTGARAFLYSETLACAAVQAGNTAGAIRVLEETGALGEKAYAPVTQSGYYWMRTQKLLADVYRQTGQVDKARAIEAHLVAALGAADPDYPLLVELKARASNTTATSTRAPHQPPVPEITPALAKITFHPSWVRLGFSSHDGRSFPSSTTATRFGSVELDWVAR